MLYIVLYKLSHLSTRFSLPHQVFVGKIPRDLYEDELVPLFESAGPIWDLRLMMDPLSGQNRGYAFITYCNKDDAQKAVKLVSTVDILKKVWFVLWGITSSFKLINVFCCCSFTVYFTQFLPSPFYFQCDNHEIRPGKYLGVCISVANNRLFVGSIPKNKTRESILEDFGKVTGQFRSTEVDLCQKLIKTNPQSQTMINMMTVRNVIVLSYRGSPRGDIVPPARRQEEEPWFLFPGVRGPQVCSTGSPPPNERQGQGVGEPCHRRVGRPRRWARPGGHGQG